MRQVILLILTIFLVNSNNAQQTIKNTQIPEILYGEWYNIDNGQIKLAIYDNMIIYHKSQWFLDSIESPDAQHYTLKLKGIAHKKIQIDLHGQTANIYDGMGSSYVMTKNLDLVKIKYDLPLYDGPAFKKDYIWFECYFEDTAAYAEKRQVTLSIYDYITNETTYNFQFVSRENSVAFQMPVNNPTIINISYSTGRKEQFYMMPGETLIELATKLRGYKYMSDAAPLNAELNLIKERKDILPGPNDLIYPPLLQRDSIQAIEPEDYKSIALSKEAKSNLILDSMYRAKAISPLTYQIEKLNIIYKYANLLLHYNSNMAIALQHYNLPYEKKNLNFSYFDFLKNVDNELGPIAPEYVNFITAMRNSDESLDYFPLPEIPKIKNRTQSIYTLIKLFTPVKDKDAMLSHKDQSFFDSLILLEHNPKLKTEFLIKKKPDLNKIVDEYSYLIQIASISSTFTKYIQDKFNWQPGTLMDLCIFGNIANQSRVAGARFPSYFFKPESGYITNQFIAKELLKLNQEIQKPKLESKEIQLAKWSTIDKDKVKSKETIKRNRLDLTFVSYDENFPDSTKQKMIETFFKVYPLQLKQYNNAAAKHITFLIDPEYNGVAATADSLTRYNPAWLKSHPFDIDVVTHEVMHIIQCYQKNNFEPRWITEGIADYVRLKMGLYNEESKWALPEFNKNQHPEDSYRVTAKFFNWLEQHKKKNIVKDLDLAMRENNYSESFWGKETNENLDQLWNDYTKFSIN